MSAPYCRPHADACKTVGWLPTQADLDRTRAQCREAELVDQQRERLVCIYCRGSVVKLSEVPGVWHHRANGDIYCPSTRKAVPTF